jgi:hypothetical protein
MQPIISCQLRTDLMERHRRAMVEYRAAVALMEALLGDAGFNEAFGTGRGCSNSMSPNSQRTNQVLRIMVVDQEKGIIQ